VQYRESLYWTAEKYFGPQRLTRPAEAGREPAATQGPAPRFDLIEAGMTLQPPDAWQQLAGGKKLPGLVLGIEVSPYSRRNETGDYVPLSSALGRNVVLSVLPVSQQGAVMDTKLKQLQVVNEFKSGMSEIDARRAYMGFSVLQRMLDLNPGKLVNPNTGEATGEMTSGRANKLLLKAAAGFTPIEAKQAAQAVMDRVMKRHGDMPLLQAKTWREKHSRLLGAVQNEKGLVTFLFAIISAVAVVMVATTFYMTVLEKTRDIGVLRAMGASKFGIMNLYLGYGLAIGVVGAAVGLLIAWAIVTHLNQIQFLLAERLGTLLIWVGFTTLTAIGGGAAGALLGRRKNIGFEAGFIGFLLGLALMLTLAITAFESITIEVLTRFNDTYGWRMWNPKVYAFDKIPDEIDWFESSLICLGAILSSVVGSLIPAILAARLNPVEAIRHE
jgi:lipoprotein-releasing system permease protein